MISYTKKPSRPSFSSCRIFEKKGITKINGAFFAARLTFLIDHYCRHDSKAHKERKGIR